jgi:ribosomal protein L37AE/L43A
MSLLESFKRGLKRGKTKPMKNTIASSYTCPYCGQRTYYPMDIVARYCVHCGKADVG